MRMTRFRLSMAALAAGIALAAPLTAGAQNLQELYQAARSYDATYLAARAQAEAAQFRAAQAEALGLPSLSASGTGTYGQTEFQQLGSRDTRVVQGALNGRYPLYNPANRAAIEQARRSLESAQAELDTAEQDLIVRVAQAYFEVLAAQDSLTTVRASKAATAEQLASAKRNFEVGTATITDTREAQARFDLGTAQEIAAENALLTRRLALDILVGRQGVQPKPLLVPVVLPPPTPANPEEWVTVADAGHPAVRRARVGLDVATLETEKARAAGGPTLDAVGQLFSQDSRGSAITLPGYSNGASIGLQLNWPLYTGGATQNRLKETLSLEERARNDVEAARRAVSQGTRTAFYGVQSGLSEVKALEAAESSSKLALEATQLGYRVGVRVNLDVLDAQRQLFLTQRDLARARYNVIVNGLLLRQASGQLNAGDIAEVNRLLAQ
jgi:outer membrane protein